MITKQVNAQTEDKMKKTVAKLQGEFNTLRTGRASQSLLEGVKVEAYGALMPLQQVANVVLPEPRTLEVKPWDPAVLDAIEKAIFKSDLGLTPANDGKMIRISVPALTEERRKELIRVARKMAEEYRISVRGERRDAVEQLKKAAKNKEISEDDQKTAEQEIEKLTHLYVNRVDEVLASKEKEILTV